MHPQMLLIAQRSEDGVGDTAVAGLDRITVLDHPANVGADLGGDFRINLSRRVFQQRLIMGNQIINLIDVNKTVTVDPGHESVHLRHDQGRALQRRLDNINTDAEADIAAGIGQGSLNQGHIHGNLAAAEKRRQIGKENWGVVGFPPVDRLAGMVTDEKRVVPKIMLQLFIGIGGHPQGPDL